MSSAAISQNFSIIAKSVRFAGMQFGNASKSSHFGNIIHINPTQSGTET
jgi:hypothetical protein